MMLESAGVAFTVAVPAVDEDLLKALLSDAGKDGDEIAQELADAKALSVSRHLPNHYVLAADQLLICDGQIYSKADTEQKARDTLEALSGCQHRLISAAVIARDGVTLWRTSDAAMLRMRLLSVDFLDQYLSAEIPEILGSVGCYRIEGRGAQLFSEVLGDHFSIRGLPLIPVLSALREFGVIPI